MKWKLDDSRSLWPQLKELLMRAIVAGEYPKGGPFPTVRDLAQEAGVNRNTMQRAMAELEAEGLLVTNRTTGRTVTTDQQRIDAMKEKLAEQNIATYLHEMKALGYTAREAIELIHDKGEEHE
ncbi:MAG: GntR family transcriptional regulator [Firmicutes bacterium]|nr:GntR family transcriptional regulator [Bacillota bacterium]